MERPSDRRPRLFRASALDIVVKAGQVFDPEQGMAYLIRMGYFSVEVDIASAHGIVTFKLGTVEEEELLCEEELLSTHLETGYKLRYRAEMECVLLGLTRDMLPRKEEEWKLFFLKTVRAGFRQRSYLYQLAAMLFRTKLELEQNGRSSEIQHPVDAGELNRLRRELQAARESAVVSRKKHAAEQEVLHTKLRATDAEHKKILEDLKEASKLDRERQEELRQQSDATLDVVNRVLQHNGLPPMSQLNLLQLLSESSARQAPFRIPSRNNAAPTTGPVSASKTLIPPGRGVPPPQDTRSLIIDDEPPLPETHRWGRTPPRR